MGRLNKISAFRLFLYRVHELFRKIVNVKFEFHKINSYPVLIYDREGSDLLLNFFEECDVYILEVRGRQINIYYLFKALLAGGLTYKKYLDVIIACVNPNCVITNIDNNSDFYTLKQRFPAVTTIFVQNGTRGELGDIFGQVDACKNYKVDHMLVHGDAIGQKYKSIIAGNAISVGSIKNNNLAVEKKSKSKSNQSILFVSLYTVPPAERAKPLWLEQDGRAIYWHQFYEAEHRILPFLKEYVSTRNMHLQICGRLILGKEAEYNYYNSYLAGCSWEFLERTGPYSSYSHLDQAGVVVNIDSTLGYEGLGRGCKVVFLSVRGAFLSNTATRFGWPGNFDDEGPFWTNQLDTVHYKSILDNLTEMKESDWLRISSKARAELMHYDFGNSRITKILREIRMTQNRDHENFI
jgi:surface carbohydrate biosynthesis protein